MDTDVCSASLTASLFSSVVGGGKGGDIYYFSVCGKDRLTRVAVADVVGHGEAVSKMSQRLYDSLAKFMNGLDGSQILQRLNKLAGKNGHGAITTAVILTYNAEDSRMYYSYAGHPPILICRKGEKIWRPIPLPKDSPSGNLPLGVLNDTPYDEQSLELGPGDRLFSYTDGVIEAPRAPGQLFGMDGLLKVLNQNAASRLVLLKQKILDSLYDFTRGSFKHDDVTFLVMEIN